MRRILFVLFLAITTLASAKESFPQFVDQLKVRLHQDGFSQAFLDEAFNNVTYLHRTVYKSNHQPEVKLTLQSYVKRMVTPGRIHLGYDYYHKNIVLLQAIEKKYQVEANYIVALLGMESSYGRVVGQYPEISTLTTLLYDHSRSRYFYKELTYALKILQKGDIPLAQMKGSWAGAMGQPQFMPTHYYDYAVDYDHDGKKDIWHSTPDVLASIAYSLHRYHWQYQAPVAIPIILPKHHAPWSLMGLRHHFRVAFWLAHGITAKTPLKPYAKLTASLIKVDNSYFLAFPNYRILLQWNHSNFYVMSIIHLAHMMTLSKAEIEAETQSHW